MAKETRKLTALHGKDSDKGLRIVIVSEGYRAAELDQFRFDADLAAQTILGTPPFGGVPICIARLDVPSKDSSAYQSLARREADTAFRARFDKGNPHLLLVNEEVADAFDLHTLEIVLDGLEALPGPAWTGGSVACN